MNYIRLIWHRMFRRPVVTGPHRIYLRRIPTGVLLDLENFLTYALTTIADDEELLGQLLEYSADRAASTGHDGHAPESLLLEQIIAVVGAEVPVYGGEVTALADQLRELAPKPRPAVARIPRQRTEGGAAA
ncbi:hypothetical protein [Streptomyces sp. NPDC059489]|uniref:hypothetical protein n=1 Tax=Streptomyces sp. NPDC059489 TaxID=3346849 RepID=UPI003689F8B0